MSKIKKSYYTLMDDHFPDKISIIFGSQTLIYKKKTWKIPDSSNPDTIITKGLRYGENPGQEAALYELINGNLILGDCKFIGAGNSLVSGLTEENMLQFGKHPGKTNLTDLDNGLNILKYLGDNPSAVILKHNNPCGVAYGDDIETAYMKANDADRVAAFGGCLVVNKSIDIPTARLISENYLEVVAAPDFEDGVLDILSNRKNLRIVRIDKIYQLQDFRDCRFVDFKSLIDGGIIIQQSPINKIRTKNDLELAKTIYKTKAYCIQREPTEKEYEDMLFGWNVEQGITSNSVIYVKDDVTVGIGTGEQDRVGVAEIAVFKAYTKYSDLLCHKKYGCSHDYLIGVVDRQGCSKQEGFDRLQDIEQETIMARGGLIGSVMVSDAFFPFRDGVEVGIKEGVTAVIQPGGSERDFEVIEACNEANPQVTMVFTGQRAFKH